MHRGRHKRAMAVVGTLLLIAVGCEPNTGDIVRVWSEDVALDDGRVIRIDRRVAFTGSNALGGGAYSATETDATLSFRGNLAQLPDWRAALMPLVLYRSESPSTWVVVAKTPRCEVWVKRGKPMPPYWEFRLAGEVWVEVPLSDESIGRKTNLVFMYNSPLPANHISLETKAQLQSDDRISESYLSIASDLPTYCGG